MIIDQDALSPQGNMSLKLEALLGSPALMRGDDQVQYEHLRAAVAQAVNPIDIFDWICIFRLIDEFQSGMRYRKMKADAIDSAKVDGIRGFLKRALEAGAHDLDPAFQEAISAEGITNTVEKLAWGWFGSRSMERKAVDALLKAFAVDPEALFAAACMRQIHLLEKLEKSIAGADARCDAMIRQLNRRKGAAPGSVARLGDFRRDAA
jgi:hypothetical protein